MKSKSLLFRLVILQIILLATLSNAQDSNSLHIVSKKEIGQIEVGSPYIGIEIHKSFPMLNRISFYYPVANSFDISEDYWKRENYRIMEIGVKIGNAPKELLKNEVYQVDQTPYSVSFSKVKDKSKIEISYEFCKDEQAMLATYKFTNQSNAAKEYEVYTRLSSVLKTSHTYREINSTGTDYNQANNTLSINYNNVEAGRARVFISNTGIAPESFTSTFPTNYSSVDQWWMEQNFPLPGGVLPAGKEGKTCAAFIYKKKLEPGESLVVKQVIGSIKISDGDKKIEKILSGYKKDIANFENYVLKESLIKSQFKTGDDDLDFTSRWAKAILAVDRHYIDGNIEPMPAPAEYNFFFTHDMLLTDLAAVNFDLSRVKNDLKFIISHADKDKIIPHAYYWKDTTFMTEFAGTENWNHFWFVMVSARYLRHSGDIKFLNELYPYIAKSVETALKNKGKDTLMWSMRPDWWDIGNNSGPRAYMTILAVKALRELNFINSSLKKSNFEIIKYSDLADNLNKNLVKKLWDKNLKYLISYYEDGTEDKHIYMGSLLALHFNLLNKDKDLELLNTAKEYLLDEKLGIYDLFPMDFNKLIDYMHFAGNEAGEPYYYANGGIWPHGNSWYALALIKNGLNNSAYSFVKRTMTINGINNSPNGQPAMYEYRISDKNNPKLYGKIDKPQFLWAGGWYLYTIYNLFGLRENEWNISFAPYIPEDLNSISFPLTYNNKNAIVEISGKSNEVESVSFDGKQLPSLIIPYDISGLAEININMGKTKTPYIKSANGKLYSPEYDKVKMSLEFTLESFSNNLNEFEIVSPYKVVKILSNNKVVDKETIEDEADGLYTISVKHNSAEAKVKYKIDFK
jgi:hypothetical protein